MQWNRGISIETGGKRRRATTILHTGCVKVSLRTPKKDQERRPLSHRNERRKVICLIDLLIREKISSLNDQIGVLRGARVFKHARQVRTNAIQTFIRAIVQLTRHFEVIFPSHTRMSEIRFFKITSGNRLVIFIQLQFL